jgi:hypothetical protein
VTEASRIVVVVEANAEWPGWLAVCNPLPSGSLVLVQEQAETLCDFVGRVTERCGTGGPFELGIIACSERFDDTAIKSRSALARALVGETGQLFLTAGARCSGRCRHGLSALAADLTAESKMTRRTVSLRFGTEHGVAAHSASNPG